MLAASAAAAAWSVRLAAKAGPFGCWWSSHPPPKAGTEASALPSADPLAVADPQAAVLIAAVQERGSDLGIACQVDLRCGEEVATIVQVAATADQIVILPCCPRDPAGPTFQRVQAIIRLTSNPVLMI